MTQTSFHDRVAHIEAKHSKPSPGKGRRYVRLCVMFSWIGFLGLSAGLWKTGAISPEQVADLIPSSAEQLVQPVVPKKAASAKPVSKRSEGARWTSVDKRSNPGGTFFTLSTKGGSVTRTGGGGFVDFIEMRVDRQKQSQHKGRLGFEGQNAHANKRRDKFWRGK